MVNSLNLRDWSTRANAYALAERITFYWLQQGYHGIRCEVSLQTVPQGAGLEGYFGVRSNMVNGYPPLPKGETA